jgi:hypothetical protein
MPVHSGRATGCESAVAIAHPSTEIVPLSLSQGRNQLSEQRAERLHGNGEDSGLCSVQSRFPPTPGATPSFCSISGIGFEVCSLLLTGKRMG